MIHRKRTAVGSITVPEDPAYLAQVTDILQTPKVGAMAQYVQLGSTSCLEHSVNVSYLSYLFCKKHGLNAKAAARGGLLHDLFLYDWHFHHALTGKRFHGLTHPRTALENAKAAFQLTELEENIILRHMWPLTLVPPRHREAFVVVWFDKYCSVMETLRRPVMLLYEKQDERIKKRLSRRR